MLTKKQFAMALVTGSILFLLVFGLCYTYFYETSIDDPLVQQDAIEVMQAEETNQEILSRPVCPRILENTKIIIQRVKGEEVIERKVLQADILIGKTKEDIENDYPAYQVVLFEEDEVILQKEADDIIPEPSYTLAVQQGIVGILEKGEREMFRPLNLSIQEFSAEAAKIIEKNTLVITPYQKQKLQYNPYYIEAILQNYSGS